MMVVRALISSVFDGCARALACVFRPATVCPAGWGHLARGGHEPRAIFCLQFAGARWPGRSARWFRSPSVEVTARDHWDMGNGV